MHFVSKASPPLGRFDCLVNIVFSDSWGLFGQVFQFAHIAQLLLFIVIFIDGFGLEVEFVGGRAWASLFEDFSEESDFLLFSESLDGVGFVPVSDF